MATLSLEHALNSIEFNLYFTLIKFWMNKDNFDRAGFEPATYGLTCRSPYFVNIFVRGRQSEVMKPYTAL